MGGGCGYAHFTLFRIKDSLGLGPNHPDKDYEWAIVSVGAPSIQTPFGCQTGTLFVGLLVLICSGSNSTSEFSSDGAGLWLFSRTPVDPWGTLLMRKKAAELGFDLTVLRKVEHRGCLYEGATLK